MDPFALNLIMIIGFVIGSGLIIAEAFIPGFGVAGISGVILEIVALRCCWLQYGTVPTLFALVTVTALRPAGQIEIGGTRLNASSTGDFIERGAPVLVTGMEGDHYTIRRKA